MAILDLTTFTEVDPNSVWTVSATRCTGTDVIRTDGGHIYKDFGANYFGEYKIWCDVNLSSDTDDGSEIVVFKLANTIEDGSTPGQSVFFERNGSNVDIWARSINNIAKYVGSLDTVYYLEIYRIVDRMYVKVYASSSDRINETNLLATIDPGSGGADDTAWRYLYCGVGYGVSVGSTVATAYSENFEIQYANIPDVDEEDTLTLTDDVNLKLLVYIEEQLALNDGIVINKKEQEIEEILNISDELEVNISLEKFQPNITLSLSDEVIAGYVAVEDVNNKINLAKQGLLDLDNQINIAKQEVYDIDNRFNSKIEALEDINNVINTAILELDDIKQAFHSAKGTILDIDNKINTLRPNINDITNDFRMRASWQVGGDLGVQSKGKKEVKVYFDNVEITDVDIDSIKLSRVLGNSWTATFDLDRPYDNSKPTLEATVDIKYNDFPLYHGYLTTIEPTDDPEKMGIICQNKHWLDNRNKVWFNIGHKPSDERELYYETIQEGLSALGINFGIGAFIPQTMNLFGTGRSEAITRMVHNSGNFDWYYDVNENKKLWTANGGSIINLEPQKLGENLGLYQVLKHNISESAENIVNKLRVQMGDQIIRYPGSQGEEREYKSRIIGTSRIRAVPLWNSELEKLAKNSGTGYGFDSPNPNGDYSSVFRRYRIINTSLGTNSQWTDWRPPVVNIVRAFGTPSTSIASAKDGKITEGFSIDFDSGILTLNEPLYYSAKDSVGHNKKLYAPTISLILYKQTWITHTETTADNPEIDISNDLMFFTTKVGDYSKTILETLGLTGLSIQGGTVSTKRSNSGDLVQISNPSWDDTNFAKDLAYWRLSETADKKISGSIILTIDAVIFYGIELNKKIMIDGIIENPLNITSMTYDFNNFTVTIEVENFRYYKRTVNMQSHGQGMSTFSSIST